MSQPADLARDLIRAMAAGDRGALARLIDLYGRGLTLYCARALHLSGDAEDAVQEVFLRAWGAAARYDPTKGAVSTWLYRIAVNHCIDRNRRHGFRRFIGLAGEDAPEIEDDAPDASRSLAARQNLGLLRRHIAALPDRQRQALLLRVLAEMDTASIAATLGTGTGAVEQLLVRARNTLRDRMGADFMAELGGY
jgi:RNA polymerase sigma-70 factor (ECF subfamily)